MMTPAVDASIKKLSHTQSLQLALILTNRKIVLSQRGELGQNILSIRDNWQEEETIEKRMIQEAH